MSKEGINDENMWKGEGLAVDMRGGTTRVSSRLRNTSTSERLKAEDLPNDVDIIPHNGSPGRRPRRRAWVNLESEELSIQNGDVGGEGGSR